MVSPRFRGRFRLERRWESGGEPGKRQRTCRAKLAKLASSRAWGRAVRQGELSGLRTSKGPAPKDALAFRKSNDIRSPTRSYDHQETERHSLVRDHDRGPVPRPSKVSGRGRNRDGRDRGLGSAALGDRAGGAAG